MDVGEGVFKHHYNVSRSGLVDMEGDILPLCKLSQPMRHDVCRTCEHKVHAYNQQSE